MIPAISDQRTNPAPILPETEADIDIDFVNELYLVGETSEPLSQLIDYLYASDFIINGIGLVGFVDVWNVSGSMFPAGGNPAPDILNEALAILLTGNCTIVMEWHNYRGNFSQLFAVSPNSNAESDSQNAFGCYDYSWNYFFLFDELNPGGDWRSRQIDKGADTPDYLDAGIHAVAITRKDEYLSVSINGGIVKKVTLTQHDFSVMVNAWLAGPGPNVEGDIVIGRVRLYETPLDDEFLPGLAQATVLAEAPNQYFADAQTITSGQTLDGSTFCADDVDDPSDTDEDWQPSVWYKFVAPATTNYTIDILNSIGNIIGGAEYNGWVLDIYDGGPSYASLNLIDQAFASPWPTPPSYTLAATSGTIYWFKVYGDGSGEGIFQISVS